eukprot:214527_1
MDEKHSVYPYDDEIQETIVNSNDLREAVYQREDDPIFHCIGQFRVKYEYSKHGNYKKTTGGTGTIFWIRNKHAFVLTAAHNVYRKVMHCVMCDYYIDKYTECPKCHKTPSHNNYKFIKATDITFKRRSIKKSSFETVEKEYEDLIIECDDYQKYIQFPSVKSGYDWCVLSFTLSDSDIYYYEKYVSNITIRSTFDIWNQCSRFSIFGYPFYEPKKPYQQNRIENDGMYGMSGKVLLNEIQRMKLEWDNMGTMNMFLHQTALDTEGGQSGSAIFCKKKHLKKKHSIKEQTIIFSIHVGGSVKGKFNVGTVITNDILCKIYDICGITTAIRRVKGKKLDETWVPMLPTKKVEFQAHVGIEFGADGTGIVFAFSSGKMLSRQSHARNANIKQKSSILLEANAPYKLIAFGLEATEQYKCRDDNKLLYFENLGLSLYHLEEQICDVDDDEKKYEKDEYVLCVAAENGVSIAAQIVFARALEYAKTVCMNTLKQYDGIHDSDVVQWILTIPCISPDINAVSVMLSAAEKAGIKHKDIIDHVLIATESKCIAVLSRTNIAFEKGRKCILLHLEQQTSFIAGYVADDSHGVQSMHSIMGNWTGSCIDAEFGKLLESMFGGDLIREFKIKQPNDWEVLRDNFKRSKLYYNGKDALQIAMNNEFINFVDSKGKHLDEVTEEFKYNDKNVSIEYDQGVIEIPTDICDDLFETILTPLIERINSVLGTKQMVGCTDIILSGMLSKSEFIQHKIKNEYTEQKVQIHTLPQSSLSVARGAATIGLQWKNIKKSTAQKTIAIETCKNSVSKNDKNCKNDVELCNLITKGMELNGESLFKIEWFECVASPQNTIAIKMHSCDEIKPHFTERSCIGIGFLKLPDDWKGNKPIAIGYYDNNIEKKLYVAVKEWSLQRDREIKIQWTVPML